MEDRRTTDKQWREKLSKRVSQVEGNQKEMMELLEKNTSLTQSIVDDTAEMRDLTRCLRGVARFILWIVGKISAIVAALNAVIKPILVLCGFGFAIVAAAIALFNHGKVPDWALRVLSYLFA